MNQQVVRDMDIAVIGMAGRFPHAANIEEYWKNISEGKDCIDRTGVKKENFVDAYGQLDDMYLFDAEFFGVNHSDAVCMDPQFRIVMECVYHGLEDAGYAQDIGDREIGLFLGADENYYVWNHYYSKKYSGQTFDRVSMFLQNTLASSISYKLDLQGPSMVMRAACATSLATVHYGIQSLLNYECNLAVAGGVNIREYDEGYQIVDGVSSSSGALRAYDENGDGYVPGNGMGVLVMKRAEDAIRDGDHIYALLKSSALVNDGSRKAGYHASSVQGEAEAMVKALELSGVSPEDIQYIEGHGTATPLGDRVEIQAIDRAYGSFTGNYQVEIGSVKSNIGHLNVAAGIAGLIKTILCVEKGMIPPTINFAKENPELLKYQGKISVSTSLHPWKKNGVRRAAVSSFGFGGSDAHVIVEQAPEEHKTAPQAMDHFLVPVSGITEAALERNIELLKAFIAEHHDMTSEIAYTYQVGKRHCRCRSYLILDAHGEIVTESVNDMFLRLKSLGERYVGGEDIDWNAEWEQKPSRIPTPGYAFERTEYKHPETEFVSAQRTSVKKRVLIQDGLSDSRYALSSYIAKRPEVKLYLAEREDRNRSFVIGDPSEVWQKTSQNAERLCEASQIHLIGADSSAKQDMEQLCRLGAAYFLSVCRFSGSHLTMHQWMADNEFLTENVHFLRFIIGLIGDASILITKDDRLTLLNAEKMKEMGGAFGAAVITFCKDHPEFADIAELLAESVHHYMEFAQGKRNGNDILRQGGSINSLQNVGQTATTETVYCKLLAQILKQGKQSGSELSVMEIGGGTGQLTGEIVKQLGSEQLRYLFTDVGKGFVQNQRLSAKQNQWDFMEFSVVDATEDLTMQGIAKDSLDIMVEDNMLHLLKDLPAGLKNIRQVLKPGGYLAAVQVILTYDVQECVFGILPGWWNYKDSVPARERPYLSIEEWKRCFREAGFELVLSFPETDAPELTNTAIFLLRKPENAEGTLDVVREERLASLQKNAGSAQVMFYRNEDELAQICNSLSDAEQLLCEDTCKISAVDTVQKKSAETTLLDELKTIATEILNIDDIAVDEDIMDYEFDSLSVLILNANIKEKYHTDIGIASLYELGSLRNISEYLENRMSQESEGGMDHGDQSAAEEEKYSPEDLLDELFE